MMRVLEKSILEGSGNAEDVWKGVANLDWDQWLDFLGPKGWESLCLGYLTLQHDFVPTGLVTGSTLKDFDIIGVNWRTGEKIYGQCKKDPNSLPEAPLEFLEAAVDLLGRAKVFLFAYGGCQNYDRGIELITSDKLKEWLEHDPKGKEWFKHLRTRST